MITFDHEEYSECIDEIVEHLSTHGEEVENMPVAPDLLAYKTASEAGHLPIFTMRNWDELVGYAAFWVYDHPHHKGKVFANCDLVYIVPEHRGLMALQFFEYIEEQLGDVHALTYTFKLEHDHPELMEYLGMKHTEKVYTKVLG